MASYSPDQSLSIKPDQTSTSSMLSRTSSSSSSAMGDYIGTESCFDVISANLHENKVTSLVERIKDHKEVITTAAREFPPPIPLLAQTENLLPHMPWVLKREVTSDGRLVLREEMVRHHDYFRANRSNGRFTLHLVPLENDVFEPSHYQTHNNDVEDNLDDLEGTIDKGVIISVPDDEVMGNVHGRDDSDDDEYRRAAAEETVVDSGVLVGGGGSPRGKCLKSCFVGMRVREIRPVFT